MTHLSLLVFIVVLLVPAGNICWAVDAAKQLQGIKKEIKAKKQLITRTSEVENKVSRELMIIERSLKEKENNLGVLTRELATTDVRLQSNRGEITQILKEVEDRKQLIQKRLVALYKAGEVGTMRILFSSQTFPEMVENVRYMNALLASDRKLIAQYNERLARLKDLKRIMENDLSRKEQLKQEVEAKKQEIQSEKARKSDFLDKVRKEKQMYLASLRELEENSRRLQTVLARLEAARRAATRKKTVVSVRKKQAAPAQKGREIVPLPPTSSSGFGSQRGRLSLPVQGRVVGTFGRHKHPEFNSFTNSNGLSIAAPVGSDVRSIYAGTVVYADYFKGYGNMVIIDHGDGYFSLYAHNSRLLKRVGASVSRNEAVASVGELDSTRGPMLYFELRYQGRPVNPSPWLR